MNALFSRRYIPVICYSASEQYSSSPSPSSPSLSLSLSLSLPLYFYLSFSLSLSLSLFFSLFTSLYVSLSLRFSLLVFQAGQVPCILASKGVQAFLDGSRSTPVYTDEVYAEGYAPCLPPTPLSCADGYARTCLDV